MLYVTTRDKSDAFTAHRTLSKSCAPDGGLFIPFQPVTFNKEQILELKDKSFGKCVAEILNHFFSARLDAWDVDCCIGRHPVNLVPMSHKIVMCEMWNNPEWDLSRFVRNIHGRILGSRDTNGHPTEWTWIAIRIAFLFGIFGELLRTGTISEEGTIDIAVEAGDFTGPMAVWYARQMGLPIGMISFACGEHSEIWDLLNHGQMQITEDIQPYTSELERLIYETLGGQEAMRYVCCCNEKKVFSVDENQIQLLRDGLFCAVVSSKRMLSLVRSIYRTNTYLLSPRSALAFGALQDYRAKNNETGPAIILTEQGPLTAIETVSDATGLSAEELKHRIRTA